MDYFDTRYTKLKAKHRLLWFWVFQIYLSLIIHSVTSDLREGHTVICTGTLKWPSESRVLTRLHGIGNRTRVRRTVQRYVTYKREKKNFKLSLWNFLLVLLGNIKVSWREEVTISDPRSSVPSYFSFIICHFIVSFEVDPRKSPLSKSSPVSDPGSWRTTVSLPVRRKVDYRVWCLSSLLSPSRGSFGRCPFRLRLLGRGPKDQEERAYRQTRNRRLQWV